jgi:DNA-binding response OmpR family regulator
MKIIIIDREKNLVDGLDVILGRQSTGYHVITFPDIAHALIGHSEFVPSLIIATFESPASVQSIRQKWPLAVVVLLCDAGDGVEFFEAMELGDLVLEKPFNPRRTPMIAKLLEKHGAGLRPQRLKCPVEAKAWTQFRLRMASTGCRAEDIASIVGSDFGLALLVLQAASAIPPRTQVPPTITGLVARVGVERMARLARDPRVPRWFQVTESVQGAENEHAQMAIQSACDAYDYLLGRPEAAVAYAAALFSWIPYFAEPGNTLNAAEMLELLDAPPAWITSVRAIDNPDAWGDPVVAAIVASSHRAKTKASSTRTRKKSITLNINEVA